MPDEGRFERHAGRVLADAVRGLTAFHHREIAGEQEFSHKPQPI